MKKLSLILFLSCFLCISKNAHSARFMWCWSTSSITNNLGTARADLFSFCAAPLGDSSKAITTIYYYAEGQMPGNNTNLRSFLTDAHSHGLKVLYLDGDANWVTSDGQRAIGEAFVDTMLTFNLGGSSNQRFDGIHYDVEPQSATNWSTNEAAYWSRFTTLLWNCQSKVSTYNASNSPAIRFEADISRNWDIDSDPITSNTQVQNIVDAVAIMNYVDHFSAMTVDPIGELNYGDSIGKKVIVGFETDSTSPLTATFFNEGNTFMENALAIAVPVYTPHASYQGIAIHHYDSYRNLFTTTPPRAGFSASPTSGSGTFTVFFTDTSANIPTSWSWDFGDGGTANTKNPSHQYSAVGVPTCYTVTLIATNIYGSNTAIIPNYICVNVSPPSAGFKGVPLSGNGPLTVIFTDTSANNPTSWSWNFGDGGTSTSKNPSHQYGAVTTTTCYSVTLSVSNTYGTNSAIQNNYICVSIPAPYNGGIIWDFDSHNPAKMLHNGYFYVYNYTNTKGIGGSSALEMVVPYEGVGVRHGGGGFWLSNYAGFALNPVAPYNGPINITANNIDLSVSTIAYFSIIASDTNTFGVSFAVYDTSGSFFVPAGKIYVADTVALLGSISTTAFQQVSWNIKTMHVYQVGRTTGRKPALNNIEAFEWFFPTSRTAASGQGSGPTALRFYIDNVGATSATVPVELSSFEALENSQYQWNHH